MNYKESLYFVAKCLTISLSDRNKKEIEKQLQTDNIDWESVVNVSTTHYVFSALYCNLKRSNFLFYLPEELVSYMEYITNLNRERNEKIIKQARELNSILIDNKITPIFLKGTGNLLAGIYIDIAERMVGDIDFIFSREDYPKAIKKSTLFDNSLPTTSFCWFPPSHHVFRGRRDYLRDPAASDCKCFRRTSLRLLRSRGIECNLDRLDGA